MNADHAESHLQFMARALLLAAALVISATAAAQGFLEEIVVTAQKRSENLQDVPMSISALDAEALEAARVEKIGELALRIPNLSYSTFSSGRSELTVRGIGNSGATRSGLENSVILFVDEVYIARSTSYFFELFDLEQASVMRGPQGVLFGKNVVGGAISLTTRAPSVEDADARFLAGYGSFNAIDLKGVLSGPLGPNVGGKMSLVRKTRDGYGMDLISGADSDDEDLLALRAQLRVRQHAPAIEDGGRLRRAGGPREETVLQQPVGDFAERVVDAAALAALSRGQSYRSHLRADRGIRCNAPEKLHIGIVHGLGEAGGEEIGDVIPAHDDAGFVIVEVDVEIYVRRLADGEIRRSEPRHFP